MIGVKMIHRKRPRLPYEDASQLHAEEDEYRQRAAGSSSGTTHGYTDFMAAVGRLEEIQARNTEWQAGLDRRLDRIEERQTKVEKFQKFIKKQFAALKKIFKGKKRSPSSRTNMPNYAETGPSEPAAVNEDLPVQQDAVVEDEDLDRELEEYRLERLQRQIVEDVIEDIEEEEADEEEEEEEEEEDDEEEEEEEAEDEEDEEEEEENSEESEDDDSSDAD